MLAGKLVSAVRTSKCESQSVSVVALQAPQYNGSILMDKEKP